MSEINTNFVNSIKDLLGLLDKKYPKKASLELVGNRYNLDRDERLILYRGVFDTGSIQRRKKKRLDILSLKDSSALKVQNVIIDGYNVLISLESYLQGRVVFRAMDGYVRDTSGVYGNHTFNNNTVRSAGLIADFMKDLTEKTGSMPYVHLFLDSPLSKSGELARYFRRLFRQTGISADVSAVKNPDSVIAEMGKGGENSLTATSDTVIIDEVERVIDIPDSIIRGVFGTSLMDLGALLLKKN